MRRVIPFVTTGHIIIFYICKLFCRSGSCVLLGEALSEHDYEVFYGWLKCYNQPGMSKAKDSQGRTIWFHVSYDLFSTLLLFGGFQLHVFCNCYRVVLVQGFLKVD